MSSTSDKMNQLEIALLNIQKTDNKCLAEFKDGEQVYSVYPSVSGLYISTKGDSVRVYIPPSMNVEDLTVEKIHELIKSVSTEYTVSIKNKKPMLQSNL